MKASTTAAVIVILLMLAGVGAYYLTAQNNESTSLPAESTSGTDSSTTVEGSEVGTTPTATEAETYTASEVAEHRSEDDCWTIIDGGVYNLTSFIADHPGGDEILRACGTDATTLFFERETEDGEEVGSGTPHSNSARSQLQSLRIGTLAE